MKRVKDRGGNYVCHDCAVSRSQPAAVASGSGSIADSQNDCGIIPIDFADIPAPSTNELCPGCGMPASSKAVVCLGCGFNRRSGMFTADELNIAQDPTKPLRKKKFSCTKCGYSLDGLKSPQCPECGTINTRETGKLDRRQLSRQIVRDTYLKPAIIAVIGLVGLAIVAAVHRSPVLGAAYAIWIAGSVLLGTGVYFMFCLMWAGFDAPMHLAAIRLVAVFGMTTFVSETLDFFFIRPVVWVISILIYYGMLMSLMEIDEWKDALLLTAFMTIARFIVFVLILAIGLKF
jgi:hypothetical protein